MKETFYKALKISQYLFLIALFIYIFTRTILTYI